MNPELQNQSRSTGGDQDKTKEGLLEWIVNLIKKLLGLKGGKNEVADRTEKLNQELKDKIDDLKADGDIVAAKALEVKRECVEQIAKEVDTRFESNSPYSKIDESAYKIAERVEDKLEEIKYSSELIDSTESGLPASPEYTAEQLQLSTLSFNSTLSDVGLQFAQAAPISDMVNSSLYNSMLNNEVSTPSMEGGYQIDYTGEGQTLMLDSTNSMTSGGYLRQKELGVVSIGDSTLDFVNKDGRTFADQVVQDHPDPTDTAGPSMGG